MIDFADQENIDKTILSQHFSEKKLVFSIYGYHLSFFSNSYRLADYEPLYHFEDSDSVKETTIIPWFSEMDLKALKLHIVKEESFYYEVFDQKFSGVYQYLENDHGKTIICVQSSSHAVPNFEHCAHGVPHPDVFFYYLFFTIACCELVKVKNPYALILHNWTSGLLTAFLKHHSNYSHVDIMMYYLLDDIQIQGKFDPSFYEYTKLSWDHFNLHEMEFYGKFNLLKSAIVYCDQLIVPEGDYFQKWVYPNWGQGLHGVLSEKVNSTIYASYKNIYPYDKFRVRNNLKSSFKGNTDLFGDFKPKLCLYLEESFLTNDDAKNYLDIFNKLDAEVVYVSDKYNQGIYDYFQNNDKTAKFNIASLKDLRDTRGFIMSFDVLAVYSQRPFIKGLVSMLFDYGLRGVVPSFNLWCEKTDLYENRVISYSQRGLVSFLGKLISCINELKKQNTIPLVQEKNISRLKRPAKSLDQIILANINKN